MSYLASNLKYLRKSQKINQDELAQFLGLSRTALGDYERGKTEPSIGTLKKLIERFNAIKRENILKTSL